MDLDQDACYRAVATRDARFDGKFFTGVRTTGIYCRPICPARTPKRSNVTFFPSAAAAQEAGFRPCLRCRPETAPDCSAWRGTSSVVSRALSLIELGALDESGVSALAERLGLGERQLRRLFKQHLGASPLAVAQTRRLHLAKQLIHETQLSMMDVALASGFGSVRRFNEAFRQLFGRPPGALRGSRAAVATGEVTVLLRYKPPYDWKGTLSYLRARAIPGVERVLENSYSRTIEIDGVRGIVTVARSNEEALQAHIRFAKLSALPAIIARLRRVFDLTADPEAIGAHLRTDALLAPLVKARPGLRVPGAWDGFELAVRAILGQQITVVAATGLIGKVVATYGEPLEGPAGLATSNDESVADLGVTRVFPRPERLARADLSALGMPKQRAAAISSLAAAVMADPKLFDPNRSLEEAIARLRKLPGLGEWTAHYIAMRELREPDAFPAADIGLLRALTDRGGQRPTPKQLLERAERWRPWRAYAARHLWASRWGLTPAAKRAGVPRRGFRQRNGDYDRLPARDP